MKKVALSIVALVMLLALNMSSVFAEGLGRFEGQDVAVTRQRQGWISVVPMDSVYVKLYRPPIYIIGITSYTVNTFTEEVRSSSSLSIKFNYDTKDIYNYNPNRSGVWVKDQGWGTGTDFEQARERYYNKIFYKCYNIPFF